jgi:processive 1,2-diacylglycerol beta-glucosyltransferase
MAINKKVPAEKIINRINSTELYKYIGKFSPDIIIATHFLPAQAILGAPKRYRINTPVSLVMTDYDKHSLLITPGMKKYFVASEKIKWKLRNQGIATESIIKSGIPVDPIFYEQINVAELRAKYNLATDRRVLTVMSGGQGSAKTNYVAEALFKIKEPVTVFAIAGNNKKLEKKLRSLTPPNYIDLRVVGWTNTIHEYMRISDMIITKPGGLSTSECIVLQKPIIAVDPIPGQEVQNTYHVLENNFGVAASSSEDLLYYASQKPENLSPGYLRQNKGQLVIQAGDTIMQSLLNI